MKKHLKLALLSILITIISFEFSASQAAQHTQALVAQSVLGKHGREEHVAMAASSWPASSSSSVAQDERESKRQKMDSELATQEEMRSLSEEIYTMANQLPTNQAATRVSLYLAAITADPQYAPALNELGYCYRHGVGTEQDLNASFSYFRDAFIADPQCAQANHNLGVCYQKGFGPQQDHSLAFQFYYNAAALQFAPAYNNLGNCYLYGIGAQPNRNFAFQGFQNAAAVDPQCAQALNNLGLCYTFGLGTQANQKQARESFEQAAKLNNSFARKIIQQLEKTPLVTLADIVKGVHPTRVAKIMGLSQVTSSSSNSSAPVIEKEIEAKQQKVASELATQEEKRALAEQINTMANKLPRKFAATKVTLLLTAITADAEYAPAFNELGLMYAFGIGTNENQKQAQAYFEQAAKITNSTHSISSSSSLSSASASAASSSLNPSTNS